MFPPNSIVGMAEFVDWTAPEAKKLYQTMERKYDYGSLDEDKMRLYDDIFKVLDNLGIRDTLK